MSRNPELDMTKSWGSFDTTVKLCINAHNKNNTARYNGLLTTLESSFYKYDELWRIYKEETIKKFCKTEEEFNSLGQGENGNSPAYKYNDSWADRQFNRYVDIRDMLQEVLDQSADAEDTVEKTESTTLNADFLVNEIKSDMVTINGSITNLKAEIDNYDEEQIPVSTSKGFENLVAKLTARIETDLRAKVLAKLAVTAECSDEDYTNARLQIKFKEFRETNIAVLEQCTMLLVKKVQQVPADDKAVTATAATLPGDVENLMLGGRPREQVYLEKSKPPKFSGDDLDFAEFKRKWESQVAKAYLPEETELDKLRDAVPKEAKDQLYGVVSLKDAWAVLSKRYGDKFLISKKLKSQLKSVQCMGKTDPEKVINLKIKVRNIVTRLETLDMSAALTHDSEFLAAVYCALPDRHRVRWLDYEKGDDHWASMLTFLDKAYDQANQELALLAVYKEEKKKDVRVAGVTVDDSKDSGGNDAKRKAREACGKCPVCNNYHTWQRKDSSWWPSDRLISCKKFKDMNIVQRSSTIEGASGCPRCTSWNHQRTDCKMKSNSCGYKTGNIICQGDHSKLLHGTANVYCAALNAHTSGQIQFGNVNEQEETIFFVQDIPVKGFKQKARVMWDKGCNRVLIREAYAERCNLISKEVVYTMEVVGNTEPQHVTGKIYLLDLVDLYGNVRSIWGYGTKSIMSSYVPDLSCVRHLFPHVPTEAFSSLPNKDVDILIGLNMNELQPAGGIGTDRVGGLSALRSLFGCGWVIGGHHADIDSKFGSGVSSAAATLKVARILVQPKQQLTPEFWEADGLGVVPPPRCDSCKKCMNKGMCSERRYTHSVKKQLELDLIKEKTVLKNGEVWCDYPYIRDPSCLSFNRSTVVKVAEKVEKELIKDNLRECYNDQIRDQLNRGVAVKLSAEELSSWTGPCQYITTHAVLKNSVTTPVRVVSNSSFNNGGKSLNSCLASGPNSLNPMLEVMLRFRCQPVGIQFDMQKAYNTMRTGLQERHLRRFVWRFDTSEPWQDFALDRVHFGDACAATQLEVAKDLVADAGFEIDPEAARRIKQDVYVDDALTGGTLEQVKRFVGNKSEDGLYDGTFQKILSLGNFKIKAFGISGQKPNEETELLGDNVLGYSYNLETDMLAVSFPLNISRKRRSVRLEQNLSLEDISKLKTQTLTKRILLGVVNGFADFLGIAAPFTIRYKDLMRQLFLLEEPLSWDESIPDSYRDDWIRLMTETLQCGELFFNRSTRPLNAVANRGPELIGCSDFGSKGLDARVYLRWKLIDDSCSPYAARLAICKAKVPPLSGMTVPRGELTALTLQSRLILSVGHALRKLDNPPISAIMLVDSRCALSSVYSSKILLPFFQNRVCEIRENMDQLKEFCELEAVHYVESCLNPSDITTRATATVRELGPESFHQTGPNFFSLPREEWPVSSDYSPNDIPVSEYKVRDKLVFTAAARFNFVKSGLVPNNPWTAVEELLYYSENFMKIKRILARYIRGLNSELRKSGSLIIGNAEAYSLIAEEPSQAELRKAERLLLLHAMPHTKDALDSGKLSSLLPLREGKIIVTRGRLGERSLERLLGVSSLPILMPETRVAHLFMVFAHSGETGLVHRSAVATLARSRRYVWIIRGRNLARHVANNCVKCIRDRKQLLIQQMADLSEESVTVAPPWRHVALDFAGPLVVRGEVNKRARMKVWVLVYTCRATKSVCLLATSGYSTQDFLSKHEEFIFRKGRPDSIVSDRGTQLVAAGIVISNNDLPVNKLDWKKVTSANSTTDWQFVPIGAQHRNGLSESTVKVFKRSLSLAVNPGVNLSYSELVTLLARISFSINSRPLAIRNISPNSQQDDVLLPLTPNHLLLGRATVDVPDLEYDEKNKFSARLSYVQSVYSLWWERWIQEVLPTLVPCKRWKDAKKNLKPDDIVMMHYKGNLKDDYRLAKVVSVVKDKRDLVRTVKVVYRKRDRREPSEIYWKKPLIEETVAVQRLSLLQAAGEPVPSGDETDQLPLDAEERVARIRSSLFS